MTMNRRGFLIGLAAAGAATLTPSGAIAAQKLPMIYGNGIDCDHAGITALINGEPFAIHPRAVGQFIVDRGRVCIRNATLKLDEPLLFGGRCGPDPHFEMHGSHIHCSEMSSGQPDHKVSARAAIARAKEVKS